MTSVRLERFPIFGGLNNILGPKFSNFFQLAVTLSFAAILRRIWVRAEQQAGLADLGICFIIGPLETGCVIV